MLQSVLTMYNAGKLSKRADVDRELGIGGRSSSDQFYYYGLEEWYGNPWHMVFEFDARGQVTEMQAAGD